jgi:hypothetical protein
MIFDQSEVLPTGGDPSWATLTKEIDGNLPGQWIFRALKERPKNLAVPILSSFDEAWNRRTGKELLPSERRLYEAWMLREFKREAYHYLTHLPERDDYLEWMALGRHYGMPSRLVDFTYSFYIAVYFAISELAAKDTGWILAVNHAWHKDQLEIKVKTGWAKKYNVPPHRAAFQDKDLFRGFAFNPGEDYVAAVNPLRRNPRLAAQQGLFMCPGNITRTFDENLATALGTEPNVKKLIPLPCSMRDTAMKELRRMNISSASLFRDLSGWAMSQRDVVHGDILDEGFRRELELELTDPRPIPS